MDQQSFLKLFEELIPLKKSLAGKTDYRQLRFTYDDIIGFLDEKILYVFNKYEHLPYQEVKALTITSMKAVIPRLFRVYNKEVNIEVESYAPSSEEEDHYLQIQDLLKSIKSHLTPNQYKQASVVLIPPIYVLSRVNDPDKRIPSYLFLQFLGIEVNSKNIKAFNTFRRYLYTYIRENFCRDTFEFIPKKTA
jgi:hypothetical protein